MRTVRLVLALALMPWLSVACAGALSTSSSSSVPLAPPAAAASPPVQLPNRDDSVKFAAFGDFGNGSPAQYQTAQQMIGTHDLFPFDLVTLLGDNIYGGQRPKDFERKFAIPYQPLLARGVTFHASLGNHDGLEQRNYPAFNMGGQAYYSFAAPRQSVRFFALDSGRMDAAQLKWLEQELQAARETWKIAYFHHPLYSSARKHGSDVRLRAQLEPLFVKYGVRLVLSGHDHVYERVKPQQGITYFVLGSGGELRRGNLRLTNLTDAGFDTDNAFLVAEIVDQTLYLNAVSRTGQIVDSGTITR